MINQKTLKSSLYNKNQQQLIIETNKRLGISDNDDKLDLVELKYKNNQIEDKRSNCGKVSESRKRIKRPTISNNTQIKINVDNDSKDINCITNSLESLQLYSKFQNYQLPNSMKVRNSNKTSKEQYLKEFITNYKKKNCTDKKMSGSNKSKGELEKNLDFKIDNMLTVIQLLPKDVLKKEKNVELVNRLNLFLRHFSSHLRKIYLVNIETENYEGL